MTDVAVAKNIAKLKERIRNASQKYGRAEGEITLLGVSKTKPASVIREAAAAGLADFGENYLREALEKQAELADLSLCWHYIGPIQSNKTREIAENFTWVHSVDRLKIARRLSEQRPDDRAALQVCIQVNVSGESSKSGVALAELPPLALAVADLPRLELRGLMAIPAPSSEFDAQRAAFALVREARDALREDIPKLDTLSMGMSADLEAAIAEGATIVRVGTGLFGPRER